MTGGRRKPPLVALAIDAKIRKRGGGKKGKGGLVYPDKLQIPRVPGKAVQRLGLARWNHPRLEPVLARARKLGGAALAQDLTRVFASLHRHSWRLAERLDLDDLLDDVARYSSSGSKRITHDDMANLVNRLRGRVSENGVIGNVKFDEFVIDRIMALDDFQKFPDFIRRHGIVDVDPQPLLATKVRTAGQAGSPSKRLLFVDLVLLFRVETSKGDRWFTSSLGQVKGWNVDGLVSGIDFTGKFRLGQLRRDQRRRFRGGWSLEWSGRKIELTQADLIQDSRLERRVTLALRDYTAEELDALRADRIRQPVHILHDFTEGELASFVAEMIRALGLRVAKR